MAVIQQTRVQPFKAYRANDTTKVSEQSWDTAVRGVDGTPGITLGCPNAWKYRSRHRRRGP